MDTQCLMLAVVQPEDAEAATQALTEAGLRVTRISSIGGFLRAGNVTLLIGVRDERADGVLQRIQGICEEISLRGNSEAPWATVFVLDMEQYVQV